MEIDFLADTGETLDVAACVVDDTVWVGDMILEREQARTLCIAIMEAVAYLDEYERMT